MYIIIWKNSHKEPFVEINEGFKETFYTYDQAKERAEEIQKDESPSKWFFDYQIYEEATS